MPAARDEGIWKSGALECLRGFSPGANASGSLLKRRRKLEKQKQPRGPCRRLGCSPNFPANSYWPRGASSWGAKHFLGVGSLDDAPHFIQGAALADGVPGADVLQLRH